MAKDSKEPKNTARRPNMHWFGRDLLANGFFWPVLEHGAGSMIMGLYVPEEHLRAWLKIIEGGLSEDGRKEAEAIMRRNPPELTWRMDDEARTLCGSYNESHTCPPDCS